MRKIWFAFSLCIIVIFVLSKLYRNEPTIIEGQTEISEVQTTPTPSVPPTLESVATLTPSPTIEALHPTPTQTTITDTVVIIEPTLDSNLLVDITTLSVDVEAEAISFHPVLKFMVLGMDYKEGAKITGTVLDTNLEEVPEIEALGPPCTPGQRSWLTGYNWMSHATHTAVDIACTDMRIGAASRGKVYAILWEAEAYSFGSSGKNVLTISKIPANWKDLYGMTGWMIFGNGHMKVDVPVTVGQNVEGGDLLGDIGMTGNTRGPHNHYYIVWLKPDGTTQFVDPNNWSAIGTR